MVIKTYTKRLRNLANAVKRFFADLRPIWQGQGEIVTKAIQKNVESGKNKYEKLSTNTLTWRKKKGYEPGPILRASGKLIASFGDTGGDGINKPTKKNLVIGTKLPYAAIQQSGSTLPKWNGAYPARPFVTVDDELSSDLADDVSRKLSKEIVSDIINTRTQIQEQDEK
jgi:phage gpG-like protein